MFDVGMKHTRLTQVLISRCTRRHLMNIKLNVTRSYRLLGITSATWGRDPLLILVTILV